MNKVINLAEGGPISDVVVTNDTEQDLLLLSMGFRHLSTVGSLRLWACRLCNSNNALKDILLMNAGSHSEAVSLLTEKLLLAGETPNDSHRFY
jgi:hypothetical protein